MGKIIAIEGIDGSGKNTQANNLFSEFSSSPGGCTKLSFPRYADTFFGREVGNYLNGKYGSLDQVHPKFSAMLYAGDRFQSRAQISSAICGDSILICDRYVHSNVAHQSARMPLSERSEMARWIEELEFDIYKLPRPDVVLFLDMPPSISSDLVLKKEKRDYTSKKKDLHEADGDYLAAVYEEFKTMASEDPSWATISCCADGNLLDEAAIYKQIRAQLINRGLIDR